MDTPMDTHTDTPMDTPMDTPIDSPMDPPWRPPMETPHGHPYGHPHGHPYGPPMETHHGHPYGHPYGPWTPAVQSCICLDRFVAVLFPLSYGQLKDTKYMVSLSAVVLGLTFTYASAKTIWGLHNFEKVFTPTILATFGWMVLCNGAILVALKRSRGSGKDDMHPMKKKAFKMVMSVLSIIVFNYLPPVALFPFQDHYPLDTFRCLVQPVGYAFINISSSIQPIIYLSRLEKIPFLPEAWNKWGSSSKVKEKEVKVDTISPA
ncbi:uncharacterized protein LOC115199806 [Salmo trutta]|uniref:uncharacterized protein LOC115199806 n=1 Tax=Salmo trutta TaxID=8032 RepID=UPI0011322902|nr:uncharacterized protein LOC115199806 [Salmo trutta]